MLYHSFTTESDPGIIGVRNGIMQAEIQKSPNESESYHISVMKFFRFDSYWARIDHVPNFPISFGYVKLLRGAKLTDFLSFGPSLMACPFLLNEKSKNLFKDYNIQKNFMFPVRLHQNTYVTDDYSVFYCPFMGHDVIDFKASKFYYMSDDNIAHDLAFDDLFAYELFNQNKSIMQWAKAEKLVFNNYFDFSLDLIYMKRWGLYMSSRLKLALSKSELMGLNFRTSIEPVSILT